MEDAPGEVVISPQVISTIVRQVAKATPGVARLAPSVPARMGRMLRANRAGGVGVRVADGAVTIDLYVIAVPNTALLPLGRRLQQETHRALSDIVGMAVQAVNVYFVDVEDPFSTSTSTG